MSKHPIQPLELDCNGTLRFKANAIIRHLLDHGGIVLNDLARMDFSQNDREQFAQLIGYSLGGYGELGYVSDETYETAQRMHDECEPEHVARIAHLQGELSAIRQALREPIARLYGKHPDDIAEAQEE